MGVGGGGLKRLFKDHRGPIFVAITLSSTDLAVFVRAQGIAGIRFGHVIVPVELASAQGISFVVFVGGCRVVVTAVSISNTAEQTQTGNPSAAAAASTVGGRGTSSRRSGSFVRRGTQRRDVVNGVTRHVGSRSVTVVHLVVAFMLTLFGGRGLGR